jgi:hypothetical protein
MKLGMHRISDRPDIRPDNPAFIDIRYPAGYQILLAVYPAGDQILKTAGYPVKLKRQPFQFIELYKKKI